MNNQQKLEYAKLRANGAALFGRDEEEANRWKRAVREIEADIKEEE